MAGIFDIINKAIQNPVVQGLGSAAAFGFNPLLGLAAVPAITDERKRNELALEERRDRLEASREFQDLVNSQLPVALPEVPLLSIDGSPMPSVGGVDVMRPALDTPQGRTQALGLAGRMAPAATSNQIAASTLGSTRENSVDARMRVGRELGLTGQALIDFVGRSSGQQVDPMDAILAGLLADKNRADLEAANRANREADEERRLFESNLTGGIDELIELGALNAQVGETFLQSTGLPAAEGRQALGTLIGEIGELMGDEGLMEFGTDAAAKGAFNKLAANIQFDLLKDADVGSNAARIHERFFKGTVGEIGTPANDLIIADQIEGRLRLLDARQIRIDPELRRRAEAAIALFKRRGLQGIGRDVTGGGGVDYSFDGETVSEER